MSRVLAWETRRSVALVCDHDVVTGSCWTVDIVLDVIGRQVHVSCAKSIVLEQRSRDKAFSSHDNGQQTGMCVKNSSL